MLMVCLMSVVLSAAAIPELTNAQRVQLDTADDTRVPDEPAWTGLLSSVAAWDPGEATREDVPGSAVPDYGRLLRDPAAYRGELFVVKGRYAGRQREMRTLRTGPWGDRLIEWGVFVDPFDSEHEPLASNLSEDPVAIVYLVAPDAEITPPREGQTVRVLARFYKLWSDVDAEGHERTYPVFVGRSAVVVDDGAVAAPSSTVIVGGIVVLAGLLFLVILARSRQTARVSRREKVQARLRGEAEAWEQDHEGLEPLPDDPAEALGQLERTRGHH